MVDALKIRKGAKVRIAPDGAVMFVRGVYMGTDSLVVLCADNPGVVCRNVKWQDIVEIIEDGAEPSRL